MLFHFQQFSLSQEKSAMKIGTDATLLAALTRLNHPTAILDIGAGTGVISLMLAQRSPHSRIDAIEIDPLAFEECSANFKQSPWADRLFAHYGCFVQFAEKHNRNYELIVSNPPFYSAHTHSPNSARATARNTDALSFESLLCGVEKLLAHSGKFSVIIPFVEEQNFIQKAKEMELYPKNIIQIRGHQASPIKRSIIEFERKYTPKVALQYFTIEEKRGQYTDQYRNALKDFLLRL